MKRITFVFIGMVAIVAYIATSTPKFETKVAQVEKALVKKQHIKFIND
ncbi:hypothetical protein [Olleya sp. HaHaR_3_96]|nr:hypothetical protein [Olleya sp. HaHaR_3_96]QXP60954.1 hypothetical protein H0I26_04775 [Olleya sp. HaHaR_3_96]